MYAVCALCSLIELRMKRFCIYQHVTCTGIISVSFAKGTALYQPSSREICKARAVQVRVPQVWQVVFLGLE
jgi:hypothetical protein